MNRTQELFEQYEDAYFAILMDQVAKEEGRKAIAHNKQLKEDPTAAVPEMIQRRCENTIQKAFSVKRRKKTGRILWKGIHTAAVIVLLFAATLSFAVAASPTFRANFLNMVLNTFETYTDFSFTSTSETRNVAPELEINPGWLPDGFDIVENDSIETCAWKSYLNDTNGASIRIEKLYPTTVGLDTEDSEMETVEIQGYPAQLITKNDEVRIIWLNSDRDIVYLIFTEWVPVEEALKIAENVL